jgi:hypothetical protein
MFGATGVLTRGLASLQGASEAEQKLASLLFDDTLQVISSLALNQMASYTYHETSRVAGTKDLCEKILDMLEGVLAKPTEYSTLTVHKALAVLQHMLLYGAAKVIPAAVSLGDFVAPLQNYNTAVMAQQGSLGMLMRFKGGAVDKGGPVRALAQELLRLFRNRQQLDFERATKADPNSLVPVGSTQRVAFVTDEARLHILQRRMEAQTRSLTTSNLTKSASSFGGGYTARDGQAVVGAAHGLDEMIKQARKETQKFSDDQPSYVPPGSSNDNVRAEVEANIQDLLALDQEYQGRGGTPAAAASVPPPMTDLLDFGGPPMGGAATTAGYSNDLLGTSGWAAPAQTSTDIFAPSTSMTAVAATHDPFAFAAAPIVTAPAPGRMTAAPPPAASHMAGGMSGMTGATAAPVDRFAALDALVDPSVPTTTRLGMAGPQQPAPQSLYSLTDLSGLSLSSPATSSMPVPFANSSLKVSQLAHTAVGEHGDDDGDSAFVMGGGVGAGLNPLGAAPAAPPPPPPGGGFY